MKKISFFYLVVFVFTVHIIVNCFNSVTLSPFFHSGMYSDRFARPDSLQVFEITVNGKILNAGDFGIVTWDMVHAPLTALMKQQKTKDFEFDKKYAKNALTQMGFGKVSLLVSGNLDNDNNLSDNFPGWYKTYLNGLLGYKVQSLKVNKNYFRYQNGNYILLKTDEWITI